jgi:UDP:flavonoid glycosyltransferase YjiC (YdhE family)
MRILFEPLGGALGLGPVTRCLAVAHEAMMRGHQVAFLAPRVYPLVDDFAYGLRYLSPAPVRPGGQTPAELAGEADSYPQALAIRGLADAEYLRGVIDAELEAFADFRPDWVFTEMQPTLSISAHLSGVRYGATIASPYVDRFAPATNLEVHRYVQDLVLAEARSRGVDGSSIEDLVHGRADLNVAPTVETLEPGLGALPHVCYVGPVLFPAQELAPAPDVSGDIRVLVYLGTGIVKVHELLPELIKAFPAPEYGVLVASREAVVDGRETPFQQENVTVAHHPGITRALAQSHLFVNRAGQNAVAASLLAGVPTIGVPGRCYEPTFNMRILEAHHAGRAIFDHPHAEDLAEAAQELLTGNAAQHAARLGDLLRRGGGAHEVVVAMEDKLTR